MNQLITLMDEHGCDLQTIAGKMNKTRDQIKHEFKVLEKMIAELPISYSAAKRQMIETRIEKWSKSEDS